MRPDSRIPVMFADLKQVSALLRADDALLIEDDQPVPAVGVIGHFTLGATAHLQGCTCCRGRSSPAQALVTMFLARARGEAPFFRRVIAIVRDRALVQRFLEDDVMVRARFCITAAPAVARF